MIDLFDIPKDGPGHFQVFQGFSPTSGQEWLTWSRPRGCTMAMIICINGGAAGGNGFSAAAGNPRGGGGGGGSAGATRVVVPLLLLPDTLYVSAGVGGISAGVKAGKISYVGIKPSTNALDLVCQGSTVNVGGGDGTAGAGGAAGTGGSGIGSGNCSLMGLGVFVSIGGHSGGAGGAHTGANGGNSVLGNSTSAPIVSQAGAGGAGCQSADFTGGVTTAVTDSIISDGRGVTPGDGGHRLWMPFYSYGGLGGNAFDNAVGQAGGNAVGFGCGGGGGGGGTTGGAGGDGGPGVVMIWAW